VRNGLRSGFQIWGSNLLNRWKLKRMITDQAEPSFANPISQLCTQSQFDENDYRYWCTEIREQPRYHRKQWEFCFILQTLSKHAMIFDGAKGLGFGVGREPLPAVLAARGCHIVASDMDPGKAAAAGWLQTNQHLAKLEDLNDRGICLPELFAQRLSFRVVDMNHVPNDLTGFDFTWSSCCLEHLGSLQHGIDFITRSLDCLRPGGIAVHTTEFNLASNDKTIFEGGTVLYRRKDIENAALLWTEAGHAIRINLNAGNGALDKHIDVAPYSDKHLKLSLEGFVTASIGLVIRKAGAYAKVRST
jgi:2-polyprenyl-3-methyl-5-hydroxy-6-metoxy-1,4-benzoquinol methylase